jgi:subtilisin family serine protease
MRSRTTVALIGAAVLAGSLATTHSLATAGSGEATTYVVLAQDASSVDAAIAAVQASGGRVERVNRAIGLVTATSADADFSAAVAHDADVAGVARETVIGRAPNDAVQRREAVEKEGRGATGNSGVSEVAKAKRTEPLASMQWDMRMMGATADGSYRKQPGRSDVLVGVIDTGIDGSHPDIAPNFNRDLSRNFTVDIPLIDGACASDPDGSCNDPADVDEDGHGTHVAGTIGSPINGIGIAGVAPGITLVNLRAGQDSGYFFLGPTVDALTYAGDHGVDVVNMSFFIDPWLYNCRNNPADSPAEQAEQATIIDAAQRALDYARARGVTLVAALGNEHTDLGLGTKIDAISPDFPPGASKVRTVTNDCLDMPTEGDGVISVAALGPSMKKSDYSNHGLEQNDVSAPGGFFRDFVGTPQFGTPGNLILGPYPKAVAIAAGEVDTVTGASLSPFVVADCKGTTIDSCSYYQLIQGTSMASPHAVGVAALIVSEHGKKAKDGTGRTLDPAKVEQILKATATNVACPAPVITYAAEGRPASFDAPCVGNETLNSIYGDGIVNALAAVS